MRRLKLFLIEQINTIIDAHESHYSVLSESEKEEIEKFKKCKSILMGFGHIPVDD